MAFPQIKFFAVSEIEEKSHEYEMRCLYIEWSVAVLEYYKFLEVDMNVSAKLILHQGFTTGFYYIGLYLCRVFQGESDIPHQRISL